MTPPCSYCGMYRQARSTTCLLFNEFGYHLACRDGHTKYHGKFAAFRTLLEEVWSRINRIKISQFLLVPESPKSVNI